MEALMKGFPWFWEQDGDTWEAALRRGLSRGERRHDSRRDPRRDPRDFGPGAPGEPPPPPPPGWGPFGGGPGGNPFGGNPFGGNPFGGNPFWFGGGSRGRRGRRGFNWGPGGRGPRVRKGDVRAAVLVLLSEQPRNGYQIIQEIEQRSGGMWKPSSGSVYPALQQLEDEGLVEVDTQEGRRSFRLTETGKTYVEEHKAELGVPWEGMAVEPDDSSANVFRLLGQVAMAVVQVTQVGATPQVDRARQVLIEARKSLYQILAEDEAEDEAEQVD
jgi:DNA-binding PadR family transcriptional regulator